MPLIDRYIAIDCQNRQMKETQELSKKAVMNNIDHMEEFVKMGWEQFSYSFPVKLMCFPEYQISGYVARSIREARAVAEKVPGPITDRVAEIAKKYRIYLCAGSMSEDHAGFPKTIFDACPLFSPEGKILMVYRKTNPWLPDEFWPSPHDFFEAGWKEPCFPVAKTECGNIGIFICNDGTQPEPARQLAFNGAEVLLHPYLLMDPFVTPPQDYIAIQTKFLCWTNIAYGISANGGWEPFHAPPYPMQGASVICDYQGRILSACPNAAVEAYCFDFFDIPALRAYRRTMMCHNGLANFRKELYDYHRRPITFVGNTQIKDDIDWDWKKNREYVRKQHDRFWADYYKDSVK
jgi:predicted amidohydrolase